MQLAMSQCQFGLYVVLPSFLLAIGIFGVVLANPGCLARRALAMRNAWRRLWKNVQLPRLAITRCYEPGVLFGVVALLLVMMLASQFIRFQKPCSKHDKAMLESIAPKLAIILPCDCGK